MRYFEVKNDPDKFLALTSIYPHEFDVLLKKFSLAIQEQKMHRSRLIWPRGRVVGGRPPTLSEEDFLFFLLWYFKNYPIQQLAAAVYGVKQTTICRWIQSGTELLSSALGEEFLPSKKGSDLQKSILKFRDSAEDKDAAEAESVIIDPTERQIARPVDNEEQKIFYSGKKRLHTIKFVVVALCGVIVCLSNYVEGKRHDKKVSQEQNYTCPKGTKVLVDLGLLGLKVKNSRLSMPHKKPKGKELTEEQKAENKVISSKRVHVEHCIRGIKIMHIAKHVLRSHWPEMDDASFRIPAGLHNFRHSQRHCESWI